MSGDTSQITNAQFNTYSECVKFFTKKIKQRNAALMESAIFDSIEEKERCMNDRIVNGIKVGDSFF